MSLFDPLQAACEILSNEFSAGMLPIAHQRVSTPELVRVPADRLVARESELRAAIDEVCVRWADTRKIAALMDYDAAFLIWIRFGVCGSFGRTLHTFGFRVPGKTQQEILAWLLVEFWRIYGVTAWRDNPDLTSI